MMAYQTGNDLPDRTLGDTTSRVVPLSELDAYEVADGYPELRGWDVRDSAGRSIGYVHDLLVDLAGMRVSDLDVELDEEVAASRGDRRVLIPLRGVALDGRGNTVLLRGADAANVRAAVPVAHARSYDEELAAGDRDIRLGDVTIRKTVETARVRERVPVVREDVEIERRPVAPGEDIRFTEARGDEIRIPLMVEEIVVEKRLVAKEIVIVRKRKVTEERTIEAAVRRERIEVDDRPA